MHRTHSLKTVVIAIIAAATLIPLAGCVSKSAAREQARLAYLAGQRDAVMRQQQNDGTAQVTFVGPVSQPSVEWSDGLTLTHAILKAGYTSPRDPSEIVIRRGYHEIHIGADQLLKGKDIPLEPGDVVELKMAAQ